MPDGKHVIIIGAGMCGVSAAIWLMRDGYDVTVIDPAGPAGKTSQGNAGVLASGSIVPVTVPSLWKNAPRYLMDRDSPLFIKWRSLPKLLPFMARFMGNANDESARRIAAGLDLMLSDTVAQHKALSAGTGAEKYISDDDYVFGYASREAYEADSYGWSIRKHHGVRHDVLEGAALEAYDDFIARRFPVAVACHDHGRISDPGAYIRTLAAHAAENGVRFLEKSVDYIIREGGEATGVMLEDGPLAADKIVLAAGVWSAKFAAQLGVKIPITAERGYHIEYVNPSYMPERPVMVASGKFVMTPMLGRLRCAGVAEWGDTDDDRSRAPLDLLKRQSGALLEDLKYDRIDEWMGHRPSTSDSLPVIGPFDETSNVWCAFGHQHVGLTGGPKAGRLVAQMIAGTRPNIDMTPFSPSRF